MSHLPATRLAALAAGSLNDTRRAKAEAHVEACAQCRAALTRIEAGRVGMAAIKDSEAPELGWESIAARIYWSTSSEQRARSRRAARAWRRPAFTVAALASLAALSLWRFGESEGADDSQVSAASPELTPVAASPAISEVATRLAGMITFAQGDVRVDDKALHFDDRVATGTRLQAGEGGLVVQFGDKSAFHLSANSSLELRRFDSERIELVLVGSVDVDLTERPPGQEFVVIAGGNQVVVRGTAFRVAYQDQALDVSCTRGKVVVTNGVTMVPVPAGQALRVWKDAWREASLRARPIDPEALQALDDAMYMPMLPAWSERKLLVDATTILEVSASEQQRVAVDGIAVAEGSFYLRTMRGRHQVALVDDEGELHEAEWVDGSAGVRASLNLVARSEPSAEKPRRTSARDAQIRSGQMLLALDKSKRTTRCLSSLAKQGLMAGSFAEFEIGVTADGIQEYLNLADSNLSSVVVKCLRRAIDVETLPRGPATAFSFRLDF